MYHINHEGKIYPCQARINKCPYGENRHASTEEELYYRLMKLSRDAEPASLAKNEIRLTGRLRSLWTASDSIAEHNSPVEVVVATLDFALNHLKDTTPEKEERRWDSVVERGAEAVYEALRYGLEIPKVVPVDIKTKGNDLFYERLDGKPIEYAGATRNQTGLAKLDYIKEMASEFHDYEYHKRWKLTDENYEGSVRWLEEDFNQFSHDLNTSKMIVQPMFYGKLSSAIEQIKKMDDYELLSAYDDYLLTDKYILNEVKKANNFEYTKREDLTGPANASLETWYNRNRLVVKDWELNAPKRVLLSIEMGKELDERGIVRQDNALGRIG